MNLLPGKRPLRMRRAAPLLWGILATFLALLLGLGLGSCGPATVVGSANVQELVVPLQVIQGPRGSVLALVPVYIRDQGPFAFALDTGASQSLVDREIVDSLGLPVIGETREITGVAGVTSAELIRLEEWRVAEVPLPETTAITLDLPEPSSGQALRGLLGSDILSRFGAITVDYEQQRLILRSRR